MIEIDVPRLIENIPERTTVYTPLIEAIVNSIHSIEDSGRDDGQILVRLIRSPQKQLDISSLELPEIIGFVIEDNGKSVCTDTKAVWNSELYFANETRKIIYYQYETKYPHAGAGKRIQF